MSGLGTVEPELAAVLGPMLEVDPDARMASAQRAASALEKAASHAVALTVGARLHVPGVGTVSLQGVGEDGLALACGEMLTLQWRHGGERCRLPGRAGHRRLKTLWQEWQVPPWWRDRVPLLYRGGELLAVGDIAHCESSRWRARAGAGEQLWSLCWERPAGDSLD